MLQRGVQTLFTDDVVSCNVSVAGIDAAPRRGRLPATDPTIQPPARSCPRERTRIRRCSRSEWSARPLARSSPFVEAAIPAAVRRSPCSRSLPRNEPGCSTRYSAHKESARLDLAAKCFQRFLEKQLIRTGKVDQIVGVNHQRRQIVLRPQPVHLGALRFSQLIGSPLPRARREDLKRVAPQPVGTLGSIADASRGRGVNSDAPRSEAGRPFRWRPLEDVLFAGHGAAHAAQYKDRCRNAADVTTLNSS